MISKKANLGKTAKSLIIILEKWQKYIGFALEKSNIIIRKKEYENDRTPFFGSRNSFVCYINPLSLSH